MRTNALWIMARAAVLICIVCVLSISVNVYAQTDDSFSDSAALDSTSNEGTGAETATTPVNGSQDIMVAPVVANEKAKPRDILKKELTVTNNTSERTSLYIAVRNINPETGDQVATGPADSDLSTSLANWIEITRGVIELEPGESRKIPYLIHVNLSAKPGSYFAHIAFHTGGNRAQAEGTPPVAELVLNMEVLDDANERLQLGGFTADDTVVLGDSVGFSYSLENVGNRMVEPRGSIRIFNRKGEEVGSVPLNADGEAISPENERQLAAAWVADGRFGKYKAFLDLEYGENQLASVQDTVYFWVFPWKEIFASVVGVLVLGMIGTYIVHMRAMARPVPARVYRSEPQAPVTSTPEHAAPVLPVSAPQPTVTAFDEPTVLVPRRSGLTGRSARSGVERTVTVTTPVRGAMRTVSPRSTVEVRGAVVALAPRRR